MICQEVKELLSPYIDNFLSADEKAAVDLHLSKCLICRQDLHAIQEVSRLVQDLEEVEPPVDFHSQLHQRLFELQAQQTADKKNWFDRFQRRGWISVAAAACLMVGLYFGGAFGNVMNPGANVAMGPNEQIEQPRPSSDVVVTPNPVIPDTVNIPPTVQPVNPSQSTVKPGVPGQTHQDPVIVEPAESSPIPPPQKMIGTGVEDWTEKRIIRTVLVKMQPVNEKAIGQQLQDLAASYNGRKLPTNKNSQPGEILTVPPKQYEHLLIALGQLGKIIDTKVEQTDVTDEYNNTIIRLEQLKLAESTISQNPNSATNSQLQDELAEIQSDITEAQNHLNELGQGINYTTIKINFITAQD